jgi:uncharacterized membrane protein YhhN
VNEAGWVALAGAALTAPIDWYAVVKRSRPIEYVAKPLTIVWLALFAATASGVDGSLRGWWIAALVLSGLGDVFLMLPADRFVAGLASFLAAHVAYIVGFLVAGLEVDLWMTLVPIAVLAAAILRYLLSGPGMRPALKGPVIAYVSAITVMVACAIATTEPVAIAGALSFMLSDSLIGWRRFVAERPWMALAVIVTYHLGQLGLVLFLIAG